MIIDMTDNSIENKVDQLFVRWNNINGFNYVKKVKSARR